MTNKVQALLDRYQAIIADRPHCWEETIEQLKNDGIITDDDIDEEDGTFFVDVFDFYGSNNVELTSDSPQADFVQAKVNGYFRWLDSSNSVDEEYSNFF